MPQRLHVLGRHELLPLVGGDSHHGGRRIEQGERHCRRHRPTAIGDLQVGRPHRLIDRRLIGVGRPEHGISRHHDLLAGKRREHGMAGGTSGQKGHRLDAGEPIVAEKPRQFERAAKVTAAAAAVLRRIKPQHEHAPLGAAFEPIELPEDGRLHLGITGARDRQPDRHRGSLGGAGFASRSEASRHEDSGRRQHEPRQGERDAGSAAA